MTATGPRGHPWYDHGWPALAGVLAGLGVSVAALSLGPLATAAIFVSVLLVAAPSTWSILGEMGRPGIRPAVELAGAIALGVVAATGCVILGQAWGLVPLVVVGVTSQPVLERAVSRSATAARVARDTRSAEETRRAFDEIIAHSFGSRSGDDEHSV
jgi:hypothetical protein